MDTSEEVLDGIRELVTIGVGHSAGMLNELTNARVTLTVPEIHIIDDVSDIFLHTPYQGINPGETSQVLLSFSGECTGSLSLLIHDKSAINLIILLTGEDASPDEMDVLRVETLLEVGNIITSSVMSSFSILFASHLSFQFPTCRTGTLNIQHSLYDNRPEVGIQALTRFHVRQKEIEGIILFLLTRSSFERIKESILYIMERGL